MRNRATFLGITIAVAAIATALGAAMILRSGDDSPSSASAFPAAITSAANGASGDQFQDRQENLPAGADYSQADKSPRSDGAGVGGTGSIVTGQAGGTDAASNTIVDRKIERNSTLAITVENVLDAVAKIQTAATGAGGYVSQQNISEQQGPPDDQGKPTKQQLATVQIRVPAESYDNVMSGLRGIAKEVTSENSQTTEVTAEYTDLQSQLRNNQATEKQYLELLNKATTIDEILTVGDRLSSVRAQIEQIQGQINLLDNLTAMATITVNVTLPPIIVEPVKPATEDNFAQEALNNAWDASQDVLEFMGMAAITAGVVMVWVLIPGLLGLIGWRLLGNKRGQGPAASA